jgi:O-antigen ligase
MKYELKNVSIHTHNMYIVIGWGIGQSGLLGVGAAMS